jgi:pimeloyl-ACP methyl ester carboxylesterase
MWFVYVVLSLVAIYAAIVSVMYMAQTWLLFPTQLARVGRPPFPLSAKRLEILTPDGERLAGVRMSPANGNAEDAPLMLGFGGNAWNAENVALMLHDLFPEAEVVVFHYRGYRPSTGRPSAKALLDDSLQIFDHLRPGPARRVVAVGFSIGCSVAAYLAQQRPLAGMILVTPFDSLEALAREQYWWAPVGLLLRHQMPTIDFIRHTSLPTAFIAAGRDAVVPFSRSEPLRLAIPNLIFGRTFADAGHNDLFDHPAFKGSMHEALARIQAATRKPVG